MSTEGITYHYFNIQTKIFEQQAVNWGITQAKEAIQKESRIRVHQLASKICQNSFNSFVKNLREVFPSIDYESLIVLTSKSRESLFFVDLQDQIKAILCHPPSPSSSSK